eukprot:GHVN01036067.1.p2 GENE.GHVN01036067.1~~GHVN01036067.1.p2  ORF type:complete len:171 (+),score=15.77 GHVN01036067.1:609-1121(+)
MCGKGTNRKRGTKGTDRDHEVSSTDDASCGGDHIQATQCISPTTKRPMTMHFSINRSLINEIQEVLSHCTESCREKWTRRQAEAETELNQRADEEFKRTGGSSSYMHMPGVNALRHDILIRFDACDRRYVVLNPSRIIMFLNPLFEADSVDVLFTLHYTTSAEVSTWLID